MKLPFTIFYSWQSDLDAKYNRNFILDALEKAVKALGRDSSVTLDAVIDRDTMGLPGSPSIVESITAKIAKSDLFIADISIIGPKRKYRPTPNPNVLFELGYASAILGWERIILIQNTSMILNFSKGEQVYLYGLFVE
jgi:predicted nucleotide-binding protein